MSEVPGDIGPPEEELGVPVVELQQLRDPVPEGFADRIRNAIHRRSLAGDLTRFTLWAPAAVFLELLSSLFALLGGEAEPRDDEAETEDLP